MNIHGIMTIQEPDSDGDVIDVAGMDVSALEGAALKLHFGDGGADNVAGRILEVYKVDGTDPWRNGVPSEIVEVAGLLGDATTKPFVYVSAVVWDPRVTKALEAGINLGYGVGGKILEKTMSQGGWLLTKTVIDELTLNLKPTSKKYFVRTRRY